MAKHVHTTAARRPESAPSAAGRRSLFATAPLLALALAAPARATDADTSADVELIAMCAAAVAADDRSVALLEPVWDLPTADPCYEAALDQSHQIMRAYSEGVQRAAELPAQTLDGLRAKAELALRTLSISDDDFPLAISVLRDMLGSAGA